MAGVKTREFYEAPAGSDVAPKVDFGTAAACRPRGPDPAAPAAADHPTRRGRAPGRRERGAPGRTAGLTARRGASSCLPVRAETSGAVR